MEIQAPLLFVDEELAIYLFYGSIFIEEHIHARLQGKGEL